MFVHFTICNTMHNPTKCLTYHRKWCFSMIVGFQNENENETENENENELHGYGKLVVWHLKSFGRVLDFF